MKQCIYSTALIIISTWIFTVSSFSTGLEPAMTLDQCLETAIKNNPSLKAARFSLDAAGHDINTARADFLPSLSSSYSMTMLASDGSQGPTETDYLDQEVRAFSIKLTQILYAGSRIVTTYEKSKIQKQVVLAEMNLEELELIYNIKTRFYKLMKAKQDKIMVAESVNRLSESLKSAQAFLQKQLIPYVDVLQAKVDLEDTKEQLGIAQNNINRERVALFSLMNIDLNSDIMFLNEDFNLIKKSNVLEFESCFQKAVKNRPDIQSLEYQYEMVNKDKKIALRKYLPVLKFDIGYYDHDRDYEKEGTSFTGPYDRDQKNRYWSAGINATWSMFDGGRSWYEKKKFHTQTHRIKALISQSKNMIATGIQKALFSILEANQRIASSKNTLNAALEYYTREEKRLNAGISTIPALLDAQYRLVRAKANKTQAMLDFHLAKSELDLMIGLKK